MHLSKSHMFVGAEFVHRDSERTALQKNVSEVLGSLDQSSLVGGLSIVDEFVVFHSWQDSVAQGQQLEELVTVL